MVVSDPQSTAGVDYGRTVNLVLRIQVMLDLTNKQESSLNSSLNELALRLQEYVPVKHLHIDNKSLETRSLLEAQSRMIECSKVVLKSIQPPAA